MKRIELSIEGMSCGHCVAAVRRELQKIPGVAVEDVRIGGATVAVDGAIADEKMLSAAIAAAGYVLARAVPREG